MDTECKCSLRTRLVGDGCPVCNPEYWAQFRPHAFKADPTFKRPTCEVCGYGPEEHEQNG